jgi:hypothetical protein
MGFHEEAFPSSAKFGTNTGFLLMNAHQSKSRVLQRLGDMYLRVAHRIKSTRQLPPHVAEARYFGVHYKLNFYIHREGKVDRKSASEIKCLRLVITCTHNYYCLETV